MGGRSRSFPNAGCFPFFECDGGLEEVAGEHCGAALLVLEEGGLEYDLRHVDITAGEHRSESFLAVNPRGFIPTLVTESGEVISETAAIMMYLADRHRLAELAPLPDEAGRGVLHDWLYYHVGEVQEAGKRLAYANRYSTDPADIPRIRAKAKEALFGRWRIVDRHLAANGPHHLGSRFSLVDLYLSIPSAFIDRPWSRRCWAAAWRSACGPRRLLVIPRR